MAKTTPKTTEQLVLEALEKTLRQGKEARLISAGKKPESAGLFADDKGTRKKAIEISLMGPPALLKVVRTEEVRSGKRTQVHRFVAITPQGIDFLFSKLPSDKGADLLATSSREAASQRLAMEEQFKRLVQARQQVLENVGALVHQVVEFLDQSEAMVRDTREKAAQLKERLEKLPLPKGLASETPARPPLRRPATEEENQFRQRAAQQLAFAWQETDSARREPIERALFNLGAEPIGKPGEKTGFAGRFHECTEPVFTRDPVEIVEPGWLLRDDLGGYLLAYAKVRILRNSQGVTP